MIKSIRLKLIIIFGLIFGVIIWLAVFEFFNHTNTSNKLNKTLNKTYNLNVVFGRSLDIVHKVVFNLQKPFFFQSESELELIKLKEGRINDQIQLFYIYSKVLTWGTESEAFKKSSYGLTYSIWKEQDDYKKIIIDGIPLTIRQNAGVLEIYFSAFLKYNTKALADLKLAYSFFKEGANEDYDFFLDRALKHYRKSFRFSELVFENFNLLHNNIESIVTRANINMKDNFLHEDTVLMSYFVITIFISFLVVWYVTSKIVINPMELLIHEIKSVSGENLYLKDIKVIDTNDEIGVLSKSFRDMIGLLRDAFVSRDSLIKEVSERIKIEERLRSVNSLNSALIRSLPFPLDIIDLKGNVMFSNEKFCEIVEDLKPLGKKCWELLKLNKDQCKQCPLNKNGGLDGQEVVKLDVKIKKRYFQIIHTGMKFNKEPAILEIFNDITDRKVHEETMSYENTLHFILIELLSIRLEHHTFNECLNKSLKILLNAPFCESMKKGALFLSNNERDHIYLETSCGISDENLIMCRCIPLGKCLCGMAAKSKEIVYASKVNDCHTINYNNVVHHGHYCVPILLDSEVIGVIDLNISEGHKKNETEIRFLKSAATIIASIIQRKQFEGDLEKARLDSEVANEAKSLFLTNMSHELRTPLHGILGFSKRGIDKVLTLDTVKMKRYFIEIRKSGEKLLALVNDILDLSKLESGREKFDFSTGDIRSLMVNVKNDLEVLAEQKNIKIVIKDSEFDPILEMDLEKIRVVIENLISNALKFSFDKGVIDLSFKEAGDSLILMISNKGVSIPEEELTMIFDKFYQSSKTRTKAGGTGLGLAICEKIVRGHNGDIRFKLGEDNLVTVCVTLPKKQKGLITIV